jgi:NAD(P) transhydrogenase subunit alpha
VKLAVPKETRPGERRVAITPDVVGRLARLGLEVVVESGAGSHAHFPDERYEREGASIAPDAARTLEGAALVARVRAPSRAEAELVPTGARHVSFLAPAQDADALDVLLARGVIPYSLDLLPRTSRAQAMDALSSQATVAGYVGILEAATRLPKFFPMLITAAGTVPPAKVLVLGAGVAGLQAIATARRLGAQVRAHDVRQAAKEEVQSLGATFVELGLESQEGAGGYAREQSEAFLRRQRELVATEVAASDAVVTTAAVPGKQAPLLVTGAMVEAMAEGSVVVDLAADSGGNCELTRPGEVVTHAGVTVVGVSNPASRLPTHASFLFARNVVAFVELLVADGAWRDEADEILEATCLRASAAGATSETGGSEQRAAPLGVPSDEAGSTHSDPASGGPTDRTGASTPDDAASGAGPGAVRFDTPGAR